MGEVKIEETMPHFENRNGVKFDSLKSCLIVNAGSNFVIVKPVHE